MIPLIKKHSVISSALGIKYRGLGCRWHLAEKNLTPLAQAVTDTIRTGENNVFCDIQVLKQNDRKVISLVPDPLKAGMHVAKTFYLKSLPRKLKYYKYGLDEAANIIIASEKGIPVPRLEGYGHIYNRFGVITASVLLLEYLEGLKTVSELLAQSRGDESVCSRILMRTIPIFTALFSAGCNHIDVNGGAIMLSENDDGKVSILDFQYAKYMDKPSAEVLMAETGRLIRTFSDYVSEKTISHWLEGIFSAISISSEEEKQRLFLRFQYYRTVSFELSRKERKNIKFEEL